MRHHRSNAVRLSATLIAALGLVLAACGGGDSETTTTAAPTTLPSTTTTVTTVPVDSTTTTSSTVPASTTSTSTTTTLAGSPIDFGPDAGDVLGVVAIAHDDILNFRAGPGTDQEILAKLGPLSEGFVATGNNWQLPSSIWYQGTVGGQTGWASSAFLAYLGGTDDITATLIASLGDTPEADTMEALGTVIANASASVDPASRIRMSVAPTVGDLGEVTFDVVGLGDDALFGVRLHVFGTPNEDGSLFTLKTVERTLLCGRGVSSGGLCQ